MYFFWLMWAWTVLSDEKLLFIRTRKSNYFLDFYDIKSYSSDDKSKKKSRVNTNIVF